MCVCVCVRAHVCTHVRSYVHANMCVCMRVYVCGCDIQYLSVVVYVTIEIGLHQC